MNTARKPRLDFRNTNSLWGSVLVETLARLGLRHAVISPGSRSTPLTFAFAAHPGLESIPVLDERSAAFFALGLARQHRRPVVLLCTSGTAGANYFPAVIEAQESGVPLLVITADRPPEMRECRSGQTIDQQKLFGSHVNFYHELSVPEATLPQLGYLRQTVGFAWERAQWPFAGPVQLNAPFRDPLPPVRDRSCAAVKKLLDVAKFFAAVSVSETWSRGALAADKARDAARAPLPQEEFGKLFNDASARGVIVAGSSQPADAAAYAGAVGRLSAALGWPVLADALSPIRHHAHLVPHQVTAYDTILRAPKRAAELRPDFVLCLDGWPTSKVLRGWLAASDAEVVLADPRPVNSDALHGRTRRLRCSVEDLAAAVEPGAKAGSWLARWVRLEKRTRGQLDAALGRTTKLFEGRASRLLQQLLPAQTPVVIANSMPVRDAEYFWGAGHRRLEVYFSRGANGIDGTLSTALGVAHGNRPTVLLTGDLALLHDANGFLLRPKFAGSLTVVLINNHGGGIFQHLPVAGFNPPFEEFFATPQQADFAQLCAAHGVKHVAVRGWAQFAGLVARLPRRGVRVGRTGQASLIVEQGMRSGRSRVLATSAQRKSPHQTKSDGESAKSSPPFFHENSSALDHKHVYFRRRRPLGAAPCRLRDGGQNAGGSAADRGGRFRRLQRMRAMP
ncbi:MAG: 2-succinyl-5-enolpyruvyl-6-hydroxy-3-cyclohexene-1-carboxylic-acid synthase [Opitutae bacterium]|nr:2-succinyl-5-enolpyruvyl-6-hydroxy-3-cyclohexene-1-carboxylic-acid synthase [Opitutae bacterium]